jgi:hypothetical protein
VEPLLFRNETDRIVASAQSRQKPSSVSSVVAFTNRSTTSKLDSSGPGKIQFLNLSPNARDQAICQFYYQYGCDANGSFDYVLHLHGKSPDTGFVNDMVECIGLAYMSHSRSDPQMMLAASKKHTDVIRSVKNALTSMDSAKNDETLVAVLLLGLFEVHLHCPACCGFTEI